MLQTEAERDDATAQLLELQEERRELQAQLSAKAADLRVTEGVVKQLEAQVTRLEDDLAETRRLHKAAMSGPVEMLPVPRVTHSQALATSISRMTLGGGQPPTPAAPVMQTALMPAETTSVRVTGLEPSRTQWILPIPYRPCREDVPVIRQWSTSRMEELARKMSAEPVGIITSPAPMCHRRHLDTMWKIHPTPLRTSRDDNLNSLLCQCDGRQCDTSLWLLVQESLRLSWPHHLPSLWNQCRHDLPQPAVN